MTNFKHVVLGRTSPGAGTSRPGPMRVADAARAIDSMKASLEKGFIGLDKHMGNDFLISEAGDIVNNLLRGSIPGTLERAAAAERFLKMRDLLEDRLANAPRDEHFLPKLEGVKWKTDDPLAGIVEGISPFHMADWISMFIGEGSQSRRRIKLPVKRRNAPGANGVRGPSKAAPAAKDPWEKSKMPSSKGIADGLREPKESGIPGAILDLGAEVFINALELELLGVLKTAYDVLTQWIFSLREGVDISTRRLAIRFLPHVIANVASGTKGAPRVFQRTVGGGTFKVRGTEVDWSGMTIPAPSLPPDARKRVWDEDWRMPSDRTAFAQAEKMAIAKTQSFFADLNKRQDGARKYVWLLAKKYKGNYDAILEHVATRLRKDL